MAEELQELKDRLSDLTTAVDELLARQQNKPPSNPPPTPPVTPSA